MDSIKERKCPVCGFVTNNPHYLYCPKCENVRVELVVPKQERSNNLKSDLMNSIYLNEQRNHKDLLESSNVIKKGVDANTSLGSGNAISGGIHNNTNVTDESNTTINIHNSTVNKSDAEILIENKKIYRSTCKTLFNNGFIKEEGLKQLKELEDELNLPSTIATAIREEVRALSVKVRTDISHAGKLKIESLQTAITQNNTEDVAKIASELEEWMKRVRLSELSSLYYQIKAILKPYVYIETLSDNPSEDYWKTYWSYIAYKKRDFSQEAENSLVELMAWDNFFPQQNQVLLLVIGYLMSNDEKRAKSAYSEMMPGISNELSLINAAVSELLTTDYSSKNVISMSGFTTFYAKNLFPTFIEGIEKKIKENKAAKLEEEAEERRLQAKIRNQKESILLKFQQTGSVEESCQEVGVPFYTFNEWLDNDSLFASSYRRLVCNIEKRNNEEAKLKREQQEKELIEQEKKIRFIELFERNDCDLLKTCSELSITSEIYNDWRRKDPVFNIKVTNILRNKEELEDAKKRERKKQITKKILPYILGLIVFVVSVLGIVKCQENKEIAKREEYNQKEIAKREEYNQKIEELDYNIQQIDTIKNIDDNIYFLEKSIRILGEIRNNKYVKTTTLQDYEKRLYNVIEVMVKYITEKLEWSPDSPSVREKGKKLNSKIENLKKNIQI